MKIIVIILSSIFLLTACGDLNVAKGVDGTDGKNGKDGVTGPPGPVGTAGLASLISVLRFISNTALCPSGTGLVLQTGLDTDRSGVLDPSEILGNFVICDGQVGTAITPVQLCNSTFTPRYPLIFPEIAFDIGGTLYAVYSANGGFLTELTPGVYTSNGIGADCSFTVNADGSITR